MTRHYETLFVVRPTLTVEEVQERIETIRGVIEKNGGEIVAAEDWGVRRLAYVVQKNARGHFYLIYFKAPGESLIELERNYRINEDIIKFIVVKYENRKEINAWQRLVDKSLAKSKQPASEEAPKAKPAEEKPTEKAEEKTEQPAEIAKEETTEAPAEEQKA